MTIQDGVRGTETFVNFQLTKRDRLHVLFHHLPIKLVVIILKPPSVLTSLHYINLCVIPFYFFVETLPVRSGLAKAGQEIPILPGH